MPNRKEESVLFARMPEVDNRYYSEQMEQKWEKILSLRDDVSKQLEEARQAKLIGNSLQAKVIITADDIEYEFLSSIEKGLTQLLIVSEVELKGTLKSISLWQNRYSNRFSIRQEMPKMLDV